jgi:hypothetical protein
LYGMDSLMQRLSKIDQFQALGRFDLEPLVSNPIQMMHRRMNNHSIVGPFGPPERHESLFHRPRAPVMGDGRSVMNMTQEQLQAYWAETLSMVRFQEKLDAESEEGKYKILADLLLDEFRKINTSQPS